MFVATESSPLRGNPVEVHRFGFETWHEVLKSLGCLGMAADFYLNNGTVELPGLVTYDSVELNHLKAGIDDRGSEFRLPSDEQPPKPRFLDERRSQLLLDIFNAVDTEENISALEDNSIGLAYAGAIANAAELRASLQQGMDVGLASVKKIRKVGRRFAPPPAVVSYEQIESWMPKSSQRIIAVVATSKLES
jgi:hypothetical protein